jgi:hypothetical protein
MVRSKAVHFFEKKIKIFLFFLFCYCRCFEFTKNAKKSRDARFFRSKTVHQKFSDFLKKVKKMGKSAFFPLFFLWSHDHFRKGFQFLKLFFKNENWTFIFVHFGI